MNQPPEPVEIIEMSPRDGLQNEAVVLGVDRRVELIHRLVAMGARRIEAVSFVHPLLVPAMAGAEAVMEQVPRDQGVRYAGLALNARGIERALVAGVDEVDYVIPVTEAFAKANQNSTRRRLIDELGPWRERIAASNAHLTVTFAVAFGCPYQGEVSTDEVVQAVTDTLRALELPPTEIALADTIGCGVPRQTSHLVAALQRVTDVPLRLHLHETRHTAIANATAALELGVRRFDSSVGGLGGCPFAPGAAGNVATEDLTWALHRQGFETGYDPSTAADVGRWISALVDKTPQSGLAKAGSFPA